MPAVAPPGDFDRMLKALQLKDLRVQLRARGLNPAGGQEALADRLKTNMLETGDFALKNENGEDMPLVTVTAGVSSAEMAAGKSQNNYSRPGGQNVGNMLTDRSSSRVLAPPGGGSQIVFGDDVPAVKKAAASAASHIDNTFGGNQGSNNNYSRPGGQNVGNFLTERNSSRVMAPPGGQSQIVFGDDAPVAPAPKVEAADLDSKPAEVDSKAAVGTASALTGGVGTNNNNYSRPGGQNVGNFLTERNSSRVLAPPGGGSSIVFG